MSCECAYGFISVDYSLDCKGINVWNSKFQIRYLELIFFQRFLKSKLIAYRDNGEVTMTNVSIGN